MAKIIKLELENVVISTSDDEVPINSAMSFNWIRLRFIITSANSAKSVTYI